MFLGLIKWLFCVSNAEVSKKAPEESFSAVVNNWIDQVNPGDNDIIKEMKNGLAKLQTELQQVRSIIAMYAKTPLSSIPGHVVVAALKMVPRDEKLYLDLNPIILNAINRNDDEVATQAVMCFNISVREANGCKFFWDHAYRGLRALIKEIKSNNSKQELFKKAVDILVSKTASMNEVRCYCCLEHDISMMYSTLSTLYEAGQVSFVHKTAVSFLCRIASSFQNVSLKENIDRFGRFLLNEKKEEELQKILDIDIAQHSWGGVNTAKLTMFAADVFASFGYHERSVKALLSAARMNEEGSKKIAERILKLGFEKEALEAYGTYIKYLRDNIRSEINGYRNDADISAIDEYGLVKETLFQDQARELVCFEISEHEKKGDFCKACELAKAIGNVEKIKFYANMGVN